ncbi:MAG: amidohydrolase, partial [Tenericutes bacterium HGW-Tenericutes-7]
LYTKGANYNAEHTNRGYIDIGFIADFSVFKNDLLNTDLERYKEDLVYMTVIDEKIVFRSLK